MADRENPTPAPQQDPKNVQAVNQLFLEQLRIMTQLNQVVSQMSNTIRMIDERKPTGTLSPEVWDDIERRIENINDQAGTTGGTFGKMSKVITGPLAGALGFLGGALGGISEAFGGIIAVGGSFLSFLGDTIKGLFNVGAAIIAIPFKILNGLFELASKNRGDNSLAVALQGIVKSFGALNSIGPKAIISIRNNLNRFASDGRNAMMMFGNIAQQTEAITKFAEGMGAVFEKNVEEIQKNGDMYLRFQKGLGLTEEAMQNVFLVAEKNGVKPTKMLTNMTKQAKHLGEAFKLDAKYISQNMGKALQDLAHFGHLGEAELGVAAVQAAKLGISIDKLTGAMDNTQTFDQAAEMANKLNEAFNTNIETSKLLEIENPADTVSYLAEEFRKAGVQLDKLDYRDRKMIKSLANLDDQLFESMASGKAFATTTDQIRKESMKAEKAIMSETQAMKELNPQIEMMIPPPGEMPKTLLDGILMGIDKSFRMMPEFRGLMNNLNAIMRQSINFGVKLGDIIKKIPGIRDIIGGLKDVFNPVSWQHMFDKLLAAFDSFVAGGAQDFDKLVDNIWAALSGLWSESGSGRSRLQTGLTAFFGFMEGLVRKGMGWVVKQISNGISWLSDFLEENIPKVLAWIQNPTKSFDLGIKKPGVVNEWAKIFDPLFPAMEKFRLRAWPEIKKLLDKLMGMFFDTVKEHMWDWKVWAVIFGPTLIRGILMSMQMKALTAGITKQFADLAPALGKSVGGPIQSAIGKSACAPVNCGPGGLGGLGGRPGGGGLLDQYGNPMQPSGPQLGVPGASPAAPLAPGKPTLGQSMRGGYDSFMQMPGKAWQGTKNVAGRVGTKVANVGRNVGAKLATKMPGMARLGSSLGSKVLPGAARFGAAAARGGAAALGFLGPAIAVAGAGYEGWQLGTQLAEGWVADAEKKRDELAQKADLLQQEAAEMADPKQRSEHWKKMLDEQEKIIKDEESKGWLSKKWDMAFGTGGDVLENARTAAQTAKSNMNIAAAEAAKAAKEAIVGSAEQLAKAQSEAAAEAKEKAEANKQELQDMYMSQLGLDQAQPLDIEKFDKIVKDFDKFYDQVKNVNIQEKIDRIKGLIAKVDFTIVDPKQQEAIMNSAVSTGLVRQAVGNSIEITKTLGDLKNEVDKTTKIIGDENSPFFKALGAGGPGTGIISKAVSTLTETFKGFDNAGALAAVGETDKVTQSFKAAFEGLFNAVDEMIKKTQEVDNTLKSIPAFNLAARLKPIASGMGFGGQYAYSVNGGQVNVEIHLEVKMETGKIEEVILSNHKSIIKDRLNFALKNSTDPTNGQKGLIHTQQPNIAPLLSTNIP